MKATGDFLSLPYIVVLIILFAIRFALTRKNGDKEVPKGRKRLAELVEAVAIALALFFLVLRPFVFQAFYIPSPSMHPTLVEDDQLIVNKLVYRFREPEYGDIVVFKAPAEATSSYEDSAIEYDFIKRVIAVPGDTVRITPGYLLVGESRYSHRSLKNILGLRGAENKLKFVDGKIFLNDQEVSREDFAKSIGREGAKVTVVPGQVYLNGEVLEEEYVAEDPDWPYPIPGWYRTNEWIEEDNEGNRVVRIPEGKLFVIGDNRNNSSDARMWGLLDRKNLIGKAAFIFWPFDRITLL